MIFLISAEIYAEYGYYLDALDPFVLKGKDGAEKIQSLMTYFRENGTALFDGIKKIIDFSAGVGDLPKEYNKFLFTAVLILIDFVSDILKACQSFFNNKSVFSADICTKLRGNNCFNISCRGEKAEPF